MIMLIPTLACLFWTIAFTINYKKSHRASKFITYFFATATILYGCHIIYFHKLTDILIYIEPIYTFHHQAVYILALLYMLKLTKEKVKIKQFYYLLIPAIILALFSVFINNPNTGYKIQQAYKTINSIFFIISILVFIIISQKNIIEYRKRVMNFYSNNSDKDLRAINNILFISIIQVIVSIVSITLGREYFLKNNLILSIAAIIFAIILFLLGYYCFKQKFFIDDLINDETTASTLNNQIKKKKLYDKQLCNEIITLLEKQNLYLDSNLTIISLVNKLNTNRTYISKAINGELGMNFNQLINHYRIQYAKEKILENKNTKLIEIASQSGFSSEEVFFRNFKKVEKKTPTAWRNEIKANSL